MTQMRIKRILKRLLPVPAYNWLRSIIWFSFYGRLREGIIRRKRYNHVLKAVKRRRSGKKTYPDKKFCIIYRWREHCGIFSHILTILTAILWAEEHGMIPVIDFKDVPNAHKPNEDNWWELFFEQPCNYTLEDIKDACNIKIVDSEKLHERSDEKPDNSGLFMNNPELFGRLRRGYRKNIRLNKATKTYVEETWQKLTHGEDKGFLGVRLRGSGYRIIKPDGMTTYREDIIETVRNMLVTGGMDKVFLATDDRNIISMFEKAFDDSALYYLKEDDRLSVSDCLEELEQGIGKWDSQTSAFMKKTNNKYLHNLNYIAEIMLLTKCEGVLSCRCSAGLLLPLMKDDWKYEQYI